MLKSIDKSDFVEIVGWFLLPLSRESYISTSFLANFVFKMYP